MAVSGDRGWTRINTTGGMPGMKNLYMICVLACAACAASPQVQTDLTEDGACDERDHDQEPQGHLAGEPQELHGDVVGVLADEDRHRHDDQAGDDQPDRGASTRLFFGGVVWFERHGSLDRTLRGQIEMDEIRPLLTS